MRVKTAKHKSYVMESEREADSKTIFRIRQLTGIERMELGEMVRDSARDSDMSRFVVCKGLQGWSNLLDENGGNLEFQQSPDSNIQLLPADVIQELANEISEFTILNEEDVKN